MTGKIIRLNVNRGFGFLRGNDGLSRFFHARDCVGVDIGQLAEDQAVSYEPVTSEKGNGYAAEKVRPL